VVEEKQGIIGDVNMTSKMGDSLWELDQNSWVTK
jgi:hypothetical protein